MAFFLNSYFSLTKINNWYNVVGTFRNHEDVLVRAKLALGDGVTMQLTVKSNDLTVSKLISSTIG